MPQSLIKITESTLIPISMVIAIVGGTSWLTTIYVEVHSHDDLIREIKQRQESATDTLEKIDGRLSRIEGKLGVSSKAD